MSKPYSASRIARQEQDASKEEIYVAKKIELPDQSSDDELIYALTDFSSKQEKGSP